MKYFLFVLRYKFQQAATLEFRPGLFIFFFKLIFKIISGGSISNQSFSIDKEKEAESNHATRQQKYDSSKEEIAARQAREAAIESHLQKVKQMEVAKLENRRIIQENINALVTNLSQNFQQILATMERQQLEIALSPYRYIILVKLFINF